MRDKAPEHVAQMLQSVSAVGHAMRTSTRPVSLFVQSDTAKESFAAASGSLISTTKTALTADE